MPDSIFERDADHWVPTEHAVGPWDPNALHGGAPASLFAHLFNSVEAPAPMDVARITVELLRPVPRSPLAVAVRVARPGRKVQLLEATMTAGDTDVARATAVRLRRAEMTVPERALDADPPPAPPEDATDLSRGPWVGFGRAHEIRIAEGRLGEGPTRCWFRLRYPVVGGTTPAPLERVMAASDFGNGISTALGFMDYVFINPDLTVYLHRQLEGEWVCLDARTSVEPSGIGMATSRLLDRRGAIGRAVQSLLIDPRPS